MKIKKLFLVLSSTLLFAIAGCGKTAVPENPDASVEENEPTIDMEFDAASYAQAYLDSTLKGVHDSLSEQNGQSQEELADIYHEKIRALASTSLGDDAETTGTSSISSELYQKYIDLWTKIYGNVHYEVTDASPIDASSWEISVSTEKMTLYNTMADIMTEKMAQSSLENTALTEDSEEHNKIEDYYNIQLEAYEEALTDLQYDNPVTVSLLLVKNEESWTITEEDMTNLESMLMDIYLTSDGFVTPDVDYSQAEGAVDMTYPEDLDSTDSYSIGEAIPLYANNQEIGSFQIDQVVFTEERNEFETTNPDKVVQITYTYQNTGYDEPIFIDPMSFRILNGDTVCEPYYQQEFDYADLVYKNDEPLTCTACYGVDASCQEITIYVDNYAVDKPFQISAPITQ